MYTMILGNFQKKAFGIALLILTFCIVVMTYSTYKKQKVTFPPYVNQCPDYFDYNEDTQICTDTGKIYGETSAYTINVGAAPYISTNANSTCKKKSWAKGYGIAWDGITNNDTIVAC